jgi:hypothetical protein
MLVCAMLLHVSIAMSEQYTEGSSFIVFNLAVILMHVGYQGALLTKICAERT